MKGTWHARLVCLCGLGLWAAGCCPPAAFYVETTINPDGSCERMIWQPKDKFLPDEAKTLEWKARWKEVSDASRPSVGFDRKASSDDCKYFIASGTFKNPGEIPPHYRFADAKVPDAGASELERTYETIDYGFVVQHRWREKITNIVMLAGFVKARDELLDMFLPPYIDAIEKLFGKDYNVSRLTVFIRTAVRRFLERASVILYGAAVRGKVMDENRQLDPAMWKELEEAAERCGLDPRRLVDVFKVRSDNNERTQAEKGFFRPLVVRHFRHHDGTVLTAAEADAFLQAVLVDHRYDKALEAQTKPFNNALEKDEQVKKRFGRAVLHLIGLYGGFQFPFAGGPPQYEFAIALPGELVETNGMGTKGGRTRWKFTSDELFPSGYEMNARSIVIDRDSEKKVLGRVVIDDQTKAMAFMDAVGREGPLLDGVRTFRQTGNRDTVSLARARTPEEALREEAARDIVWGVDGGQRPIHEMTRTVIVNSRRTIR